MGVSKYTPEIGERLCNMVAQGHPVQRLAGKDGFPSEHTIYHWIFTIPELESKYRLARQIQAEIHAESINRRACDAMALVEACTEPKKANAIVQAVKLEVDAFKWTAARLMPKVYGERVNVEHTLDETLAKRLEKAETMLAAHNAPKMINAKAD